MDDTDITEKFRKLDNAAKILNNASDELAKPIVRIDDKLRMLNLGIITWVKTGSTVMNSVEFDSYVGYSTQGTQNWGISLRSTNTITKVSKEYAFANGPRVMRIQAIEFIPELLDRLLEKAERMAQKVIEKALEADQIAKTLEENING